MSRTAYRIDPKTAARIVTAYKYGVTPEDILARFGITKAMLYKVLDAAKQAADAAP